MDKFSTLLSTSDFQFGFKPNHSRKACVFAFKQIIEYYRSQGSPVYVCYIDASKAFDHLNHWSLFKKLLDRKFPSVFDRLLFFWYANQHFIVQWGNSLSEKFNVTNGVWQGGILSPHFFNLYIDNLSTDLNALKVGCNFNNVNVNHLVYAGGTGLLAPSLEALQKLINCCLKYAHRYDIFYNKKKTVMMCIKPDHFKDLAVPKLFLGGDSIKLVEKKLSWLLINTGCLDNADILRQVSGIYAHGNSLVKEFCSANEDVMLILFKTYCSGFYCSSLWASYDSKCLQRFKVSYNNVFRKLFNIGCRESVSFNMTTRGTDAFPVIMHKYIVSFWKRFFIQLYYKQSV